MTHQPGRIARALRGRISRRAAHSTARSSTPMSEALAIGLGLGPQAGARRRQDLPEWQR